MYMGCFAAAAGNGDAAAAAGMARAHGRHWESEDELREGLGIHMHGCSAGCTAGCCSRRGKMEQVDLCTLPVPFGPHCTRVTLLP